MREQGSGQPCLSVSPTPHRLADHKDEQEDGVRVLIAALVLLLALPAGAQAQAEPEYSLDATGEIQIAPDGSVHSYKLDKGQKPMVEQALDKSIRHWRFEPITVEGRPVIAQTRMRITLQARPAANGDYELKVSNVQFGEPGRRNKMRPPRYPTEAAMAGLGARVVLVLKLDRAGKVVQQHVEQTSLSARAANEKVAEDWRRRFEQVSIAAAKHWTFDLTEIVDGKTSESSVRVPVEFFTSRGRGGRDNTWSRFIPGPKHPVPWVDPATLASQTGDDLGNGDVQPLDSRFKLKGDVVGTML